VPMLAEAPAVMATALAPAANSNLPDSNSSKCRLSWKNMISLYALPPAWNPMLNCAITASPTSRFMHIHLTRASSSTDAEATGANRWEYSVGITIVEKDSTFSGMFESLNRPIVFVCIGHTRTQQ